MIGLIITDEEIEAERAVRARFHALRKNNSSRALRQAVWRELEVYRWRWMARYGMSHPVPPDRRWFDVLREAPEGWTYPGLRSLERAEVAEMFPGALEAFELQCDNLKPCRFVFDQWSGKEGKLRLSRPLNTGGQSTTWIPEVGVWRRYSRHISAKPYAKEAA